MDIEDVEGGLEWMRVEERVIGSVFLFNLSIIYAYLES